MADRKWAGMMSRSEKRIQNTLGVIAAENVGKVRLYRRDILETYDKYYENRQYDGKMDWDVAARLSCEDNGQFISIRDRKPRVVFAFARVLCSRLASKLVGSETFPTLIVEDDPESQMFFQLVSKLAMLQARLLEPMRRCLSSGAVFVRFNFVEGSLKLEHFNSKYCYPEFAPNGELSSIRIQYVYESPDERDTNGNPLKRWYKLELGSLTDILFDNPPYKEGAQPVFEEKESVTHGLGYVQGQWFRTSEDKHYPDGYSVIGDILGFVDSINYSLSQSDQAVAYNQEPQLVLNGLETEEMDHMIRSSTKAWHLGKEGTAEFLENSMTGVEAANELRDKMRLGIQDIARVVLMDPEKMVAHAQSGKALEILHAPMVELITELRPMIEGQMRDLIMKIALTVLNLMQQGIDTGMTIPPGWTPKSLNLTFQWPPIFPMTMMDLQQKVAVASSATGASIISRETATRWLAKDFGILDVEEEIAKVAAQPVINPFGAF